jgi:uroporphyrinogen decarboxylase
MNTDVMVKDFEPDYTRLRDAAKNKPASPVPIYEHSIDVSVMEKILGKPFADMEQGDDTDLREYLRIYAEFFRRMGYDTVSFERLISASMPGSGALYSHSDGCIKDRKDLDAYPWDDVPEIFFRNNARYYETLREVMPPGMKAVGGPGNGIFECVQDVTGYERLCLMVYDDPELFALLFQRTGDMISAIWERFVREFGDIYAVLRMGDDLGYKDATLLAPELIIEEIVPRYGRISRIIHRSGKPFLLHSCGNIFQLMDSLIETGGIDAKHSNEDSIAPFPEWVERYGRRIGNFGGIDTDVPCRGDKAEISEYIGDLMKNLAGEPGIALGTGNSVPHYMPPEGYLAMIRELNRLRL